MHTELETLLKRPVFPVPDVMTVSNAGKILNYIGDINLERTNQFEQTPDEGLYLLWEVDGWEFHIECLKTNSILYTFRQNGIAQACGSAPVNNFLSLLQNYLMAAFY